MSRHKNRLGSSSTACRLPRYFSAVSDIHNLRYGKSELPSGPQIWKNAELFGSPEIPALCYLHPQCEIVNFIPMSGYKTVSQMSQCYPLDEGKLYIVSRFMSCEKNMSVIGRLHHQSKSALVRGCPIKYVKHANLTLQVVPK